jgi:hypothetical protein
MLAGQELHGLGDFTEARDHWKNAEAHAPDPVSEGRAIRGDAASAAKLGYLAEAVERAQSALVLHGQAAAENPAHRREEAQTQGVLTRFMFRSIGLEEYNGLIPTDEAKHQAASPLRGMRKAMYTLREVSKEAGRNDQHLLNLVPHMITGEALYGDHSRARRLLPHVGRAITLTEIPALPTSAGISDKYRREAQKRMAAYSAGAMLVTALTFAPQLRNRALGLALGPTGW